MTLRYAARGKAVAQLVSSTREEGFRRGRVARHLIGEPGRLFADDVNCEAAIWLAYRICYEAGYRTVGRLFVFHGSPLPQGVACISARSDRITVMMYRPAASKNAMPFGLVP
jgi:hypothetical protein